MEQAQELGLIMVEEVHGRTRRGVLGYAEAAKILGVSERTFRRRRDRGEADGAEGLYDPLPGSGLGGPRPDGRGGGGAQAVQHPLLGLHRQALPGEAGGGARL